MGIFGIDNATWFLIIAGTYAAFVLVRLTMVTFLYASSKKKEASMKRRHSSNAELHFDESKYPPQLKMVTKNFKGELFLFDFDKNKFSVYGEDGKPRKMKKQEKTDFPAQVINDLAPCGHGIVSKICDETGLHYPDISNKARELAT